MFTDPTVNPRTLLPTLFSDDSSNVRVTVSESVVCSETGTWQDGWIVIADSPDGAVGLLVSNLGNADKSWAQIDRATRIRRIDKALKDPLIPPAPDLVAFGGFCVTVPPAKAGGFA
jgi:hypothetical protein